MTTRQLTQEEIDNATEVVKDQVTANAINDIFDSLLNEKVDAFKKRITPAMRKKVEQITYKEIALIYHSLNMADPFNVGVKINNEELKKIALDEELTNEQSI